MVGYDLNSAQGMGVPFNIDALLHEMSVARMPMTRTPSTTSSMHRSRLGKVTKPGSAGNSPQNVQRRRTSASHKLAKYLSDLYPYSSYGGQHLAPQPQPVQQASSPNAARPLSWHPSTMTHLSPDEALRQHRLSLSFAGYQTVQVNGVPTPMTQPAMTPDLPNDAWLGLEATHSSSQTDSRRYIYPTTAGLNPAANQGLPSQYVTYLSTGVPATSAGPYFSPANSSDMWPGLPAAGPPSSFTAPPTPDMRPIQHATEPMAIGDVAFAAAFAADEDEKADNGPELVGMGLYDAPVRPDFGVLANRHGSFLGMATEARGKGLKLEETWEPPEDEEEHDGEDDAASETSQDGEHEEDDSLPSGSQSEQRHHPQHQYPAAGHGISPIEPFPEMFLPVSEQSFLGNNGDAGKSHVESMELDNEASELWLRAMLPGNGIMI